MSDIDKDTTKEDEMFDYVGIPYYKDECIKNDEFYFNNLDNNLNFTKVTVKFFEK